MTQHAADQKDSSRPPPPPDLSGAPGLPAPSTELEMLISQLTPPGALTWRALPCSLPWTKAPGASEPRNRPSDAVLDEVLENAGVKDAPAREYILSGPFTDLMVLSPNEHLRNHGRPARAIEVAAEHDISGRGLSELASWLDLTDHQLPVPRQGGTVTGDSRGGRRYLSHGRQLLRALGVWPWAHVESWSHTRRWWLDPTVFSALRAWHDKAWMRAAEQLTFNARARYGNLPSRVISVQEFEACKDFRARLAALGEERLSARAEGDE